MLKQFQEKYRLTVENYQAYEKDLKAFSKLFTASDDKVFKKKLNEMLDGLPVPTVDGISGALSRLSGMDIGFYVSSFGYSIYGGGVDFGAIMSGMNCLAYACGGVVDGLRKYKGLTPANIKEVFDSIYKKETAGVPGAALASSRAKDVFAPIRAFVEQYSDEKYKQAIYVQKVMDGANKLAKEMPTVMALKCDGTEVENLENLRQMLDIYDLVIDVQDTYNELEDEYPALLKYHKALAKKSKGKKALTAEQIQQKAVEESQAAVVKNQLDEVLKYGACVPEPKKYKELSKKYKKISKMVTKSRKKGKPMDCNKIQKIWGGPIFNDETKSMALTLTMKDILDAVDKQDPVAFCTLYYREMKIAHGKDKYNGMLDEIREQIIREETELAKLQASLRDGETPAQARLNFLNDVFMPFYVYTGAPLLDCMVELVYMDTFEDFKELPRVMQTKKVVDTILKYFTMKRVDSIKEAINLYIQEKGEPKTKIPTCDKAEARETIDKMYADEGYQACLKAKKKA